jgi:hypothetical protein
MKLDVFSYILMWVHGLEEIEKEEEEERKRGESEM